MELGPRCLTHPDVSAGWRCGTCRKELCPACAAVRKAGTAELEVCLHCGGAAQPIVVRRAIAEPFGVQTLVAAIRWPFHKEGLITALACAAVLWLIAKAGALAGLIAAGIVLAVLFHVTVFTAKGEDEFTSAGDFRGFFEDVVGPLMRAMIASMWAYGPMVYFIVWKTLVRHDTIFVDGDLSRPAGWDAAIALLLLAAGTFLFPVALLAGALGTPVRHLFNPMFVIGYAVRLGRDYALVAGFSVAMSVGLSLLLAALSRIGLPGLVENFVLLLPALMLFRALGLLVRARGDELGYGGERDYLVPVLGAVRPAALPPRAAPERPKAVHAEIALAPEVDSLTPGLVLARKVHEKDVAGAVEVFEAAAARIPPNALSAQAWLDLGKACVARGSPKSAVLAMRRAIDVAPEGPVAPQAWLQAARVLDEKLRNRPQSNQLLAELVRRHPGTPEAQFASRRLGKT